VVTRRQDGSAIAGAEVLLRQVEPWVLRNASSFDAVRAADAVAHTDPAGRFRLDGAGFGPAGIRVRAPGSRDAWVEFVVGERPAPLSVVLEEAPPAARGRVVDRFGNPVAGARVQNLLDRTTSDGAGRFTLGGVDDPTGARATHPLHGVGHASWPADGEGEIVLPGSGAVLAVAVRDDGRPPVEPLA